MIDKDILEMKLDITKNLLGVLTSQSLEKEKKEKSVSSLFMNFNEILSTLGVPTVNLAPGMLNFQDMIAVSKATAACTEQEVKRLFRLRWILEKMLTNGYIIRTALSKWHTQFGFAVWSAVDSDIRENERIDRETRRNGTKMLMDEMGKLFQGTIDYNVKKTIKGNIKRDKKMNREIKKSQKAFYD
ncbi:MAG: hypothetical protein ACTSWQ_01505 [Candidatus Thorarchaeota archaeon]